MMPALLELFFNSGLGRLAAGAAGLVALIGLYACDQRNVGAQQERAKTERAANANVDKATDIRSRAQRGAGGVPDPYTRD